MLIEGKKFDLRMYLVCFGLEPMHAYAYREGMVRICTADYELPNKENMKNTFMHLSNYSLNKENTDFSKDLIGGSKRTLSSMLKTIETEEIKSKIWESIDTCFRKTISALTPFLQNLCESMTGQTPVSLPA